MAIGGFSLAFLLYAGSDFPGFKALTPLAVALMIGGCVMQPKTKGGGDNCYTDWDGRSNPTVCD